MWGVQEGGKTIVCKLNEAASNASARGTFLTRYIFKNALTGPPSNHYLQHFLKMHYNRYVTRVYVG